MRLKYLDGLKGFLILLVIWGHAVQVSTVGDFFSTITFRTIYSFHMAAFFFVSGYVISLGHYDISTLPKRLARLIVPYITWYIIFGISFHTSGLGEFLLQIFTTGGGGLWFLLTLSQCILVFIVSAAIVPHSHRNIGVVIIGGICILLAFVWRDVDIDIRHFAKFYQYFIGGYLFSVLKSAKLACVKPNYLRYIEIILAVSFVLLLAVVAISDISGMMLQSYKVIVSWVGCFTLFIFFRKIPFNSLPSTWMVEMGKSSLGLYAVHSFLYRFGGGNGCVVMLFVWLVLASVASVWVIERIPVVSYLLTGRRAIKLKWISAKV